MFAKMRFIALLAMVSSYSAIGCKSECPPSCPGPSLGLVVVVYGGTDGGAVAVSGVEATLMGPTTVMLSCAPSANVPTATTCLWPLGATVTPGSYSLVVTAPGFRSKELSATLSLARGTPCGCEGANLDPAMVTLEPS